MNTRILIDTLVMLARAGSQNADEIIALNYLKSQVLNSIDEEFAERDREFATRSHETTQELRDLSHTNDMLRGEIRDLEAKLNPPRPKMQCIVRPSLAAFTEMREGGESGHGYRKIAFIKSYRSLTGNGLADSKHAVEKLEAMALEHPAAQVEHCWLATECAPGFSEFFTAEEVK